MTDQSAPRIRVVVVDDQGVIRTGLRLIVDHEADMIVVGEAGDGVEAVDVVSRTSPDVVLMDVRMPRLDGLAATRRIMSTATFGAPPAVLILTTFDDEAYVLGAVRAGASGFLLKDAGPDELVRAVQVVHRGESLIDPAVARTLITRCLELEASLPQAQAPGSSSSPGPASLSAGRLSELSERERDILAGLARGLSNRELAADLHLGETTVKSHVSSLLAKLGLGSRLQAVVLAYESGFVTPGSAAR